ncbi:MAG: CBS domain-containing protein [Planctomycetota bacterium]
MLTPFARRKYSRRGGTSVDYSLVGAFVCAISLTAIYFFGRVTDGQFESINQELVVLRSDKDESDTSIDVEAGDDVIVEPQIVASDTPGLAEQPWRTPVIAGISMLGFALIGWICLRPKKARRRKNREETVAAINSSEALNKVLRKRTVMRHRLMTSSVDLLHGRATVDMCMTTNLRTAAPDMTVEDAASQLRQHGYRRVMVVESDGRMAGVLSLKDCGKSGKLVRDVMTSNPRVATPDMTLKTALTMILENRISCLPVVDNEQLVGLVSTSDMLLVFQCLLVLLVEISEDRCEQTCTNAAEVDIDQAELLLGDLIEPQNYDLADTIPVLPETQHQSI